VPDRGAKNCHVANLKYGGEEIKLDLKTQTQIDAIYRSGKTGKEKAAAINDLVKQEIRKE
jgi:hypothetical protein